MKQLQHGSRNLSERNRCGAVEKARLGTWMILGVLTETIPQFGLFLTPIPIPVESILTCFFTPNLARCLLEKCEAPHGRSSSMRHLVRTVY